jgi:hypothetical protein
VGAAEWWAAEPPAPGAEEGDEPLPEVAPPDDEPSEAPDDELPEPPGEEEPGVWPCVGADEVVLVVLEVLVLLLEELLEELDSEELVCEAEVVEVDSLPEPCWDGGVEPCVVPVVGGAVSSPTVVLAGAAPSAPGVSGAARPMAVTPPPAASARSIARRIRRRAWAPVRGVAPAFTCGGPSRGPFSLCCSMVAVARAAHEHGHTPFLSHIGS